MENIELFKSAMIIVGTCAGTKAGENVLIVTDTNRSPRILRALAAATYALDAEPVIMAMLPRVPPRTDSLPKSVVEAMKNTDVFISCTANERFPFGFRNIAKEAGAKSLFMHMVLEETMIRAIPVDYRKLREDTQKVADTFTGARDLRITSDLGTDIRFTLAGEKGRAMDGVCDGPGDSDSVPGGAVGVKQIDGTAEGVIVVNGSILYLGILQDTVRCEVEKGRVVKIEGGSDAGRLRKLIEQADENAACIAEVGMGTNSKAILTGSMLEDEKILGQAHIGIGHNLHQGGTIKSNLHADMILLKPSVDVDGRKIFAGGKLLI